MEASGQINTNQKIKQRIVLNGRKNVLNGRVEIVIIAFLKQLSLEEPSVD